MSRIRECVASLATLALTLTLTLRQTAQTLVLSYVHFLSAYDTEYICH